MVLWSGALNPSADGEHKALALTAAMIAGLPSSLVVNAIALAAYRSQAFQVIYVLLIAVVPFNWAAIGAIVGGTTKLIRTFFAR